MQCQPGQSPTVSAAHHWRAVVLCLFTSVWCLEPTSGQQPGEEPAAGRYAIAVHGGAGSAPESFTPQENRARRESLRRALKIGNDILSDGGKAVDAVESVIRFLEDDPQFNAGKGAVFHAEGGHELDASIMDGKTKACGAVAAVTTVKNPISLARLVMTKTPHVLLASKGADRFAREMGVELVDPTYFDTEAKRRAWQRGRKRGAAPSSGTVGCVALDRHGDLAAGTSTGGLTNKRFGRVGDSPIIGAGTYADNQTCAVSCTGIGEEFIRHVVAYDVSALMKYGRLTLGDAVDTIIHRRLKPGSGGIIAVSRDGEIRMDYNTRGMACAAADSSGRFEVRWGGEPKKDESPKRDEAP